MKLLSPFTKLMKSEPVPQRKTRRHIWTMDESKCLSPEEVNKLRAYADGLRALGLRTKRFSWVRNWFMIELGLNAGLRVQEMATLKHKSLYIDGEGSSIFVVGKGGKKRSVWISQKFKETCFFYFRYKERFGYEVNPDGYLLNNLSGSRITKRALQKFFKEILEKAGLPTHYYIHCLRHTYSTFLLKASHHNYRFVQKQLGHSSIRTTQIYAGVVESEGRDAIERMYVEGKEGQWIV